MDLKLIFEILLILWGARWCFDNLLIPPINWVRENIFGKDPWSRIKKIDKKK